MQFDFFVIGGGSGGVRAARIAAQLGAKVGLAEESRMGGTCTIRGCVPKKIMAFAAEYADQFEDAAGYGWQVKSHFTWQELVHQRDLEIDRLEIIYRKNVLKAGVEVFDERAIIAGKGVVELTKSGTRIDAKNILVATGGRPSMPEISGIEHAISSDGFFQLKEQPKSALVIGGGYIAVEMASILHRLGTPTTLAYRGEQILRGFDRDLRWGLYERMKQRGLTIHLNCLPEKIERFGNALNVDLGGGRTECYNVILAATGRKPNTHGLELEQLGVKLDAAGAILVDANNQTSVEGIYAVGDVTNRVNLTPVAIREGHALALRLFGQSNRELDYDNIATAVFSLPTVATVGLTEQMARASRSEIKIFKAEFRSMQAIMAKRSEKTLMKLIVDAGSDEVLGCHLIGPGSAELIQMSGILLKMKARKSDFDRTVAVHPTIAEELVTMTSHTN